MPESAIAGHAEALTAWFQDLNWPGVDDIYKALRRLPTAVLARSLSHALEIAEAEGDAEWAYNLRQRFAGDLPDNGSIVR